MTVELPKDTEGREIPLDTVVLYDKEGKRREVDWYTFYPDKDRWDVVLADSSAHFSPNNLSITPPDSWEKLEEDLDKCIETDDTCRYYSESGICAKCTRPDNDGCGCTTVMFSDIKKRIRKLRGDD